MHAPWILALLVTVGVASSAATPAIIAPQDSSARVATAAIGEPVEWLAGTGRSLRIRVRGDVVDPDGTPVDDYTLTARAKWNTGERALETTTEGAAFHAWVPVGELPWFSLFLEVATPDGGLFARETISASDVRNAALNGVTLHLVPQDRLVSVDVVHDGQPAIGAHVVAELASGGDVQAVTNEEGSASFHVTRGERLSQLTAWTDDFTLGGFSFHRDPPRDPSGSAFTVELEPCRSQVIRVVDDELGEPIPGVSFELTIGTGPPHYQFPGASPDARLETDENGEATCRWLPDWPSVATFVESLDSHWLVAGEVEEVDGVLIATMRPARERQRVPGRVTAEGALEGGVAGLAVSVLTFQAERDGRFDRRLAFTDTDGVFSADYLPGARYTAYVHDARIASEVIDLMPFDPVSSVTNEPALVAAAGRPLEITVTLGEGARPMQFARVSLSTSHEFSWVEDGETGHGDSGRRWSVKTDEHGCATTFALPGEVVEASIFTPEWRARESVTVAREGVTRIAFHRDVVEVRAVTGRLTSAVPNVDVGGATVEVGSVDGETRERHSLAADAEGVFTFQSSAERLGIYARSADGGAARVLFVEDTTGPLDVLLEPTVDFTGRLLRGGDVALSGVRVQSTLDVVGGHDYDKLYPERFQAATFEATTDAEGWYTLRGLPTGVALELRAKVDGEGGRPEWLSPISVIQGEERPALVTRLGPSEPASRSFAAALEATLRDCRLNHYHAMVILHDGSDEAQAFAGRHLLSDEENEDVGAFIQMVRSPGTPAVEDDFEASRETRGWPEPAAAHVFACALDGDGRELGRIELDCTGAQSPELAAEFVRDLVPERLDARDKWAAAMSLAKETDRKVWVRISQRYCGPCYLLTRWLDDQRELLEADYVLLKIDDVRDLHGAEVAARLEPRPFDGIPFSAIFDADGELLITSRCSIMGNVGFPSAFEGKRHLRKMLSETAPRMTPEEIEELLATLHD